MWNSTFKDLTPVDTAGYCFHFYEPPFTHQNAPWVNEPEIKQERIIPVITGMGSYVIRSVGWVLGQGPI